MHTQQQGQPVSKDQNWDHLPGYSTRWMGLLFIGISLLVISLDNTVLNVAIPSISRDLEASASDLQWIIDAYSLVFASLLLTMGAVNDRFGRKRLLQIGLVLFGAGSLWAALSPNTEVLISARAFLGIGAAIIMPATLSIISASFPPHERPQAFAIWAAIFGLGVGVGPVIGGLLLERYEWHAAFFINLPVVVVALTGGYFFIAESRDEDAPRFDLPGVVLSVTGLFALVYGIIKAGELGWTDGEVLISFAAAGLLLGAFAYWEGTYEHAMLPLYFFKNMSFTGANNALALVTFSLFGSLFFMSQYLQSVLGYTALESGIRLLPLALTLMVTSASSARVAERLGTKYTVALGIAIAGTGLLLMSRFFDVDTSYSTIVAIIIFFALGMGLTFSPATNSVMQSVPVSKAGIGSAMNDTTRQLGGAFGVAVLGTILNSVYQDGVHILESQFPAQAYEVISSSIQGAHVFAVQGQLSPELATQVVNTANTAFVDGMNQAMFVGAIIMYGASLLSLLILPSRVRQALTEEYPQLLDTETLEGVSASSTTSAAD